MIKYEIPSRAGTYISLFDDDGTWLGSVNVDTLVDSDKLEKLLEFWVERCEVSFDIKDASAACRIARDELEDRGEL